MDATLHRYATASQMNYLSVEDSFSTLETEPQTSQLVSSLSRCLIAPPTYSQAWMTLRRTMSYQQSALHKFLFFICTFCFFIAHATSHFGPGFESVSSTIIFSQMLFTLHHNAWNFTLLPPCVNKPFSPRFSPISLGLTTLPFTLQIRFVVLMSLHYAVRPLHAFFRSPYRWESFYLLAFETICFWC